MARRRVNLKAILADQDLRRELMVPTIQAVQAREGIETTRDQAERAYYVVNEADKAAFFDLERFRGGKRSEPDRREEMFLSAVRQLEERIRYDVARSDFVTIEGAPLAYRRIQTLAPLFKDFQGLEASAGKATKGLATTADSIFVRKFWELPSDADGWEPFAKGGEYCRFYYDIVLRVDWRESGKAIYDFLSNKTDGSPTRWINAVDYYFKPGLTWPRRTQRGFNLRLLPEGCIFSDKGPSIFPYEHENTWYLLALGNAHLTEYLLQGLTSFGSWEVGAIQKLPIPQIAGSRHDKLSTLARGIYDYKASWDQGNEVSSCFDRPWLVRDNPSSSTIAGRLDNLSSEEASKEAHIQQLYAELNDEVYKLYRIPDATRAIIEETLGERPPEVLWPQMEGKSNEQKRMEHVWRLLSYAVKRVVDADEDGIVPFMAVGGETALVDRVSAELANLFPDQDINRVEVDITNELRRKVKGYRAVQSIREWLEDIFFDYHISLYKKRPILWHIASSQGRGACAVGALCHYHKFDRDRLAKLRGSYLRDAISLFRREAGLADQEGRTEDRQEWQAKLEEAQSLDQRLQWVQEGQNGHPAPGDCRIRTPWKSEDDLPSGWQPDIDDGVAVNILPLQTAGVLRVAKVV